MRTPRWSPAFTIAALAVSAGASTCALAPDAGSSPAEAMAIQGLGFELFLGLAAIAGATLSAGPVRERLGLRAGRMPAGVVALLVLGTVALSHALDVVIDVAQLGEHGSLAELERTLSGVDGRAFWLAMLGLALAPGVSEELLCRGLVQRGLVPSLGGPAAVALAALLFGALHVDPVHAVFAAVLGLYLGLLSHLAASVRPAIVCHAVNNLCAVLTSASSSSLPVPPALSIGLGGGFALAVLAWAWRRTGAPPRLEDSRRAGSGGAAQLGPTDEGRIGRL